MSIAKLPEAIQKQVSQRLAELLAGETEKIAIMVYEIGYREGASRNKERTLKHCGDRLGWLETQRVAHPTEDWAARKSELDNLSMELKAFSEEPV